MEVCYVPTDAAAAAAAAAAATDDAADGADGVDGTQNEEDAQESGEARAALAAFWEKVTEDVQKVTPDDFKQQALPLARIKRIMKLDEEVKMISSEAPLLFAKAAEIFIHELTLRAWIHTEENKRRTLQKNDINFAAAKSDQYDFLIDILPPDELKQSKPKEEAPRAAVSPDQVQYYLQLAQQHQAALQQPQVSLPNLQPQAAQPGPQIVQVTGANGQQHVAPQQQANFQLVQQVVSPTGEIQQIPIQLTPNQLNVLRMQMQSGSNQPIIIQTGHVNAGQPQIVQVASQNPQPHPVYLTQVTAMSDNEIIT